MNALVTNQAASLARALSVDDSDPRQLVEVLKATAFKGQVTDSQMIALLVVANQYGLNPWTKEIYAFPDRNNGIVPVVGVDGWSRIINENPNFDGMDFEQDAESCTCIIYRKDRAHPIRVTEYMAECKREGVAPWKSHPRRMLRHKALIQCARIAFGFVGIYDQDEAERIVDGEFTVTQRGGRVAAAVQQAIPQESPERDEALKEAMAAAAKGSENFRAFWKGFPEDKRGLVKDRMDEFKAAAQSADQMLEDAA